MARAPSADKPASTALGRAKITANNSRGVRRGSNKDLEMLADVSVASAYKKPKPHRLKPLDKDPIVVTKMSESEKLEQKIMMKDIESDINSYLDYDNIVSQMQTAFTSTSNIRDQMTPSMMSDENTNSNALVVVDDKVAKRQQLKNRVKQITQTNGAIAAVTQQNVKQEDLKTFITGVKPGEIVEEVDDEKPKKYFASVEEELWDEVDGFEAEMNNMLKELSEIETTLKEGADLREMQGLIDVTKEYMGEHFKGMDKIKDNIMEMDRQATECL